MIERRIKIPVERRIKRQIALLTTLAALTAPTFAGAQPDDALYQALGAKDGIAQIMGDFAARLKADARIGSFFKESNVRNVAAQLTDQVCEISGGPCKLDAPTMKKAHADLNIGKADFNALVELLQQTLADHGVAFAVQNRLLALLAPMHRDVVTR